VLDVSNGVKAYMDNESNENKLSHRWRKRTVLQISVLKCSCEINRAGQRLAGAYG